MSTIFGTNAADVLDGKSRSQDILAGGRGNDRYFVHYDYHEFGTDGSCVYVGSDKICFPGNSEAGVTADHVVDVPFGGIDTVELFNCPIISIWVGDIFPSLVTLNDYLYFSLSGTNVENVFARSSNCQWDLIGSRTANVIAGAGKGDSLWGGGGSDRLSGGGGSDWIRGGRDADTASGGSGSDKLFGDAGNDRLYGGTSNDSLYGGRGRDELTGNSGGDNFIFRTISDAGFGRVRDTITDFRLINDYIVLSAIDADTTRVGNQSFEFIGRSHFSGEAAELRCRDGLISGDVDGNGRADFQIALANGLDLREIDFVL